MRTVFLQRHSFKTDKIQSLYRGHPKAYTILELVVVLATIAVLAAIGGISYLSMQPAFSLSGAAKQISNEFMAARMNAINQNNRFKIFFLNDHEYKILDDTNGDNDEDEGETSETKNIQDNYPDVTISANNNPIFTPDGTVKSTPTITLSNLSGSKQVAVSIAGRIEIQ